jgi:hypothetical protein
MTTLQLLDFAQVTNSLSNIFFLIDIIATGETAVAIQDFLICFEMMFASVGHWCVQLGTESRRLGNDHEFKN